ncbi:DNA-binding protein [Chromobacterium sp. Panama]|uniref:DNA-binding protein n=1 Tax=Chromobacterium sp. Panama TaxID=2161826 RepID=UPI00351AB02A
MLNLMLFGKTIFLYVKFTLSFDRIVRNVIGLAAMKHDVLSLEDVRSQFEQEGVTVTEWAHAHGFRREDVYAVLNGRTKGRHGASHRIAIALGLKQAEKTSKLKTAS